MKKIIYSGLIFFMAFAVLCATKTTDNWMWRYSYLEDLHQSTTNLPQFDPHNEYFLVVLVDAHHADYSSPYAYLSTLASSFIKHHSPDPGHAWIVLGGKKDGEPWIFEGGHSVDCSHLTKAYVQDMLGFTRKESDPNPARFLFQTTMDGFFEYGPGDNRPTFAAAFPLTEEGFERICKLFEEDGYDFSQWGIKGPNCVQFALTCLASIGIELDCQDMLPLPSALSVLGKDIHLWSDETYSSLPIKTPDLLEKRLWELVKKGNAFCATRWYGAFKDVCEKGHLTTAEIPAHPKPTTDDVSSVSSTASTGLKEDKVSNHS